MSTVVPIATLLAEFGFTSAASLKSARLILEDAGLTRPHKMNISTSKRQRIKEVLATSVVLTCGDDRCSRQLAATRRQVVRGAASSCAACGGRATNRELHELARELWVAGVRSLLVVGGSPNARQELQHGFAGASVNLATVDGVKKLSRSRAKQVAAGVDLIVIWAPTILSHAVSENFSAVAAKGQLVRVPRRGASALAADLKAHLRSRAA